MRRQLVVHLRACRAQVDVLEPVRQRPADIGADREAGNARIGDDLKSTREDLPRLGDLGTGILIDPDVVPDRRLVGRLEPDAVELIVVGRQILPRVRVVLLNRRDDVIRERDDVARFDKLVDQAGLGNERDIGGAATLDLRAERGRDVVAERLVGHCRPGLLLEEGENLFEVLLLGAGPVGCDIERLPRQIWVVSAGLPGRVTIVGALRVLGCGLGIGPSGLRILRIPAAGGEEHGC